MRFTVVTLFPEMFESVLDASILGKASRAGLVCVEFVNPRDFATDNHRSVDDTPYGSGPGMVMKCDQLVAALESIPEPVSRRVLLSPVGRPLCQTRVRELSELEHLVLVCGRYEGVDERVVDLAIDESLSLGDYVLTGGELGAMVMIDAIARHLPGVLGKDESADDESFAAGLLEYPQYTRPAEFRGVAVPEVLLSGHHANIQKWRRQRAIERTAQHRPELLQYQAELVEELASRTHVVLAHHPVVDRNGKVVTTSVTNFDIHDIARSCATYGVRSYYPVSPIRLQREKIERIVEIWQREISQAGAESRGTALSTIEVRDSIETVLAEVEQAAKAKPWVVCTSAKAWEGASVVGFQRLRAERIADTARPVVIILGTGWGLDEPVIRDANQLLEPLIGIGDFNHLSVRSALTVILDRLFGHGQEAPGC